MKTILKTTLVFALFHFNLSFAQEKNIETHSIDIENFISYLVEHYERDGDDIYNLFFLIQASQNGFSVEDKVVLQQAFSLMSKRLSEENSISILGYSGLNGVALEKSSIIKTKKIMYTIDNFKSSIKEFQEEGIAFAYEYADKNFDYESINRVVMIRVPNSVSADHMVKSNQQTKKKKNNAVVLKAIALLPEIISVLKD